LLFFQEACFIKLNRVEPPKNLEKLQKKEKERIEWKMKMKNEKRKKENIPRIATTPELFCFSFLQKL
jgi:hypothetical protein